MGMLCWVEWDGVATNGQTNDNDAQVLFVKGAYPPLTQCFFFPFLLTSVA